MVNTNLSFRLRSWIKSLYSSSPLMRRTFSRSLGCSIASSTRSTPSSSYTSPGNSPHSTSASDLDAFRSSTTSGYSLYHAVATGDHLACSSPTPFTQWHSNLMHCFDRNLATNISSCTTLNPSSIRSRWSPSKPVRPVSSGISDPVLSHTSESENTFPSPPSHVTSIFITAVFRCVFGSAFFLNSNSRGSTRSGIIPSRCARTSSWMMDVLFTTNTCSIAMVGTSAIMTRRRAFAIEQLMPSTSNSITISSYLRTFNLRLAAKSFAKSSMDPLSLPTPMLLDVYMLPSGPQTTRVRCSSRMSLKGDGAGVSFASVASPAALRDLLDFFVFAIVGWDRVIGYVLSDRGIPGLCAPGGASDSTRMHE
mmetsp:Transcript_836/g.2303  ORF Transcript_836/g.2303 Transcript_836/m.2303 type:complete len:365 (-) Transcript_836:129-1223(-)